MSSILGNGYTSTFVAALVVNLKSPQILTEPSGFCTGTIGAAQSECCTGIIIPSFSNLSSSFSVAAFMAWGIALCIMNHGDTSGF